MVDFSPKTVFRKNPCDFFRLKTPKNEGADILYIPNLKQPSKPFLQQVTNQQNIVLKN